MIHDTLIPVRTGAEAFVQLLNANGVDYVFLNPGTDTFPIQEAIARLTEEERRAPRLVLCPHESVAMAAAHGYFQATGRAQVVLVHVDSGTLQVGGALHNAQRGHIGVVFCAGRAPLTIDGDVPGSRSLGIHWIQEQIDQGMIVRGFTKWDYELRRNESVHHVVNRAFQVANAQPPGPVYLTLPREVLMEELQGVRLPHAGEARVPSAPQADSRELAGAARTLATSSRPLIIVGHAGRATETPAALVALAELIGAPVSASSSRLNFPTSHPLWAGRAPGGFLGEADAVLMVDVDVPYVPAVAAPPPDAAIIWIDIDPVKESIPLFTFPAHRRIHADSATALPALTRLVKASLTDADRERLARRSEAVEKTLSRRRDERERAAQRDAGATEITPAWLTHCLDRVLGQDVVVMDETVTNAPVVADYLTRTEPGTLFSQGGSSLGWALGAAMGMKLAAPERTVVALMGDGAFLFACPTAALWASEAAHAPFLAVVYNNQLYNAVKRSWDAAYPEAKGRGSYPGTYLAPSPDYAMLARACRAHGERVETPDAVEPALARALDRVRAGQSAVVDVRLAQPR